MAYSNLDDVDYLVEDNAMDEFAYRRKWKRPMVEWHIGGASWEQNANAGNVPTIISARDSDLVGVRIFQTHQVQEEKRKFATQIDKMTLRDSREMNYDSKLQNMSWFCYTRVNTLSQTNMITW